MYCAAVESELITGFGLIVFIVANRLYRDPTILTIEIESQTVSLAVKRERTAEGASPIFSTHVVPRLRRCKHPEFPASCPGRVHVCAFRRGKAHEACGTDCTPQEIRGHGAPSGERRYRTFSF